MIKFFTDSFDFFQKLWNEAWWGALFVIFLATCFLFFITATIWFFGRWYLMSRKRKKRSSHHDEWNIYPP